MLLPYDCCTIVCYVGGMCALMCMAGTLALYRSSVGEELPQRVSSTRGPDLDDEIPGFELTECLGDLGEE